MWRRRAGCCPATRFAVEAYVHFVRERTLLEAIASSLTELFSPVIISERMDGMLANYDFVTRETLAYFDKRPPQAAARFRFRARLRQAQRKTPEAQQSALAALEFKCNVLWSMLDALLSCLCGAQTCSARRFRARRSEEGGQMVSDPAAPAPPFAPEDAARACRAACG